MCDSDSDTSEGELTFDELASSYKELSIRSAEVCQEGVKQKNLIIKLEDEKKGHLETIENINNEVSVLKAKLDQMYKSIRMLNSGTEVLDEILQSGKNAGNMTGIGYDKGASASGIQSEAIMSSHVSKPMTQIREKGKMRKRFQRWRCHHCGRFGHIKPFCFKLYGYPDQNMYQKAPVQKKTWVPKRPNVSA